MPNRRAEMLTMSYFCLKFPILKKNITEFSKIMIKFAENHRAMEQEIQDISIKRIQEAIPQLRGIENELIIDYTEYSMPDDKHPIHHYPLRLDGLYIGVREKGKATFNINLKEISGLDRAKCSIKSAI